MKKVFCVLLAAALFFTLPLPAFAQDANSQEELLESFLAYLKEKDVYVFEVPYVKYITEENGWTVFYGSSGGADQGLIAERVGGYVFFNYCQEDPNRIGLYAKKDGIISTLQEAYDTGTLPLEKIAEAVSTVVEAYRAGDTDGDGEVTVSDVLNIQKYLGKILKLDKGYQHKVYDYNGDGEIRVQDVLEMQKDLAKAR